MKAGGCPTGKASYRTMGRALAKLLEIHITNLQAAAKPLSEPIRAYRCPQCNRWHLTSQARYSRSSGQRPM